MSTIGVRDIDRGWKEIVKLFKVKDAYVLVGLHSDAEPYERGQGEPANVAQVGSFHEFGTSKMEARPFLRPTFEANVEKYKAMQLRIWRLLIDRKINLRRGLGILGQQASADVKLTIRALTTPPLKESTVKAKMRKAAYMGQEGVEAYGASGANPLIDTGHMLQSVTYATVINGQTVDHPSKVGG